VDTLHEDQFALTIISRSVLLRLRNVSHESCTENQNTHFTFNNFFFFENLTIYEILRKIIVEPDRSQMTMWHLCIACRIPKAKNTRSEYVILIAFTLLQWLGVNSSMLRYSTLPVLFHQCTVPPLDAILSHRKLPHILKPCLSEIYFNIVFSSTSVSCK